MPHDMIAAEAAEIRSLGHQRLAMLAQALRQPMPEGFTWNFSIECRKTRCGSVGCALGVAMVELPGFVEAVVSESRSFDSRTGFGLADQPIADFFEIDRRDVADIFYHERTYGKGCMEEVTPEDVAGGIERFLATGDAA